MTTLGVAANIRFYAKCEVSSYIRKTIQIGKDIFNWYDQYRSQYNMVGLVDLNPSGKPTYVWKQALNGYTPKNKEQVWVYERR